MPLDKYFSGHGTEVMKQMKKKYGKRAKEVFYATANKMKRMPHGSKPFTEADLCKGYMTKK